MAVGNGKDYHSRYKVRDSAVQSCAAAGWRGGLYGRARAVASMWPCTMLLPAMTEGCACAVGACKPYCLACQRLLVAFVPVPLKHAPCPVVLHVDDTHCPITRRFASST